MGIEFQSWAKIPRLNREMCVTEKIDGTQAAVGIVFGSLEYDFVQSDLNKACVVDRGGFERNGLHNGLHNVALVYAQSRNRLIDPGMDNHGFANWVWRNAEVLVQTLGAGLHFGEWWGSGIQRGYGMPNGEKRFSLFNVKRWSKESFNIDKQCNYIPQELDVVPVLHRGPFSTLAVRGCIESLKLTGSIAAPGFMRPEGVVVYHTAGNVLFKVTIENDESPKSAVNHV